MPKLKQKSRKRPHHRLSNRLGLVAVFVVILSLVSFSNVRAATLSSVSLALSDPRPSQTGVTHTFTGTIPASPGAIKCIKMQYTDTATGSTVPGGMVTTSSTLSASTTYITPASWTLANPANGTIQITNAAGQTPTAGSRTVIINGITNPSTADTRYWLKFNTYNNTDCATSPVDNASTLFILTNGSTLTLTVDDTLSFTVNAVASSQSCNGTTTTAASTATTIPFGTVTSAANGVVCQDLTAATNATNGYTISVRNTQDPTNALSQSIADFTGTNAAPAAFSAAGTEAYGYSTNDGTLGTGTTNRFTNGGQKWAAMQQANEEIAYEPVGVTSTTYRIGHQVGIALTTEPGTYSTTVIYTCTPVY